MYSQAISHKKCFEEYVATINKIELIYEEDDEDDVLLEEDNFEKFNEYREYFSKLYDDIMDFVNKTKFK